MNINDLPVECLVPILNSIEIAVFDDGVSNLGNLNKCGICSDNYINCKHLTEREIVGIKFLKLVCSRWRNCISEHFVFVSGPRFILPDLLDN